MDEKISLINRYLLRAEACGCEMFRGQTNAAWPLQPITCATASPRSPKWSSG